MQPSRRTWPRRAAFVAALAWAGAGEARADDAVRVVRVVDSDHVPVPDVKVARVGAADDEKPAVTDADGRATIAGAKSPAAEASFFDGFVTRRVTLTEPVTEVVAENYPLVEIDAVDAATGRAIDGRSVEIVDLGGRVRRTVSGPTGALRIARDDWGTAHVDVRVAAPQGMASAGEEQWDSIVAPARRARLTILLWPETKRVFRMIDRARPLAGVRLRGAQVFHDLMASEARIQCAPSGEDGLVTIAGLPRIPFARAAIWFEAPTRNFARHEPDIVTALDADPRQTPLDVALRIDDPYWLPPGMPQFHGHPDPVPDPAAPLDVLVLRRDGSPAVHALVRAGDRSARTGLDGHARFDRLPDGPTPILAWYAGAFPAAGRADVGTMKSTVVREAEGRRAVVEVVDVAGKPLAGAIVGAVSLTIAGPDGSAVKTDCRASQFDGDVEILRTISDAEGKAALDVPVGRNRFCASLGEAFAFVETDAAAARIVLVAPK